MEEVTAEGECCGFSFVLMAKDFAKDFYASDKWRRVRLGYISHRRSIDGGLCEECHENPGYIVHHRVHLTPANIRKPEIAVDWKNLEFVCKNCHEKIHETDGKPQTNVRRVTFDAEGNPHPVTP